MDNHDKLLKLCRYSSRFDKSYLSRLKEEILEIKAQNEQEYFLELYENKVRYTSNENNLLIPFLLGIVDNFDINSEPVYTYGDFPDIDIDYIPEVRDYIKNKWVPEYFGKEYVANIGSYNTFGIKGALIDMARVHGKDRNEILRITTKIGLKDDEGKTLTWDKALELYSSLKEYADRNPDVAIAARKMLHRNRSMGKHAGGLIISNKVLDEFVPLVKTKGSIQTAWTEGLHDQDLGPVGLVKIDNLVITNLTQIAYACHLIKKRYNLESICALPGQDDFSDIGFLEDREVLVMADKADLKCIFQFDSEGIRNLVKRGGVDRFEDLVAYTALYRPATMEVKADESYCNRKKNKEKYELHPVLEPILGNTYGIIAYQEQCAKILNVVGEIPLKDCEILRKAISKKKEEYFKPYKAMFIENGQKVLGWPEEEVLKLWDQLSAFSSYAFNLSHAVAYTYISFMLLWLKVKHPIEFYNAIFRFETAFDKLKEYKVEAARHGIKVKPVDINKSGVYFEIVDDCLYFGLSNVKGIGPAVAEQIVRHRPYKSFLDFLVKFGTDANVVKPLIGLRVFGDDDPVVLHKIAEMVKEENKKRDNRKKRYEASWDRIIDEIEEITSTRLTLEELLELSKEPEKHIDPAVFKESTEELMALVKKFIRSFRTYGLKIGDDIPIENMKFDTSQVEVDQKLVHIYSSVEESQKQYYGFLWTHPLEKSPDYEGGLTFEDFRASGEQVRRVEAMIESATKTLSKNKKTTYWLLRVEDAAGEVAAIQIWEDDWDRFSDELTSGNLVNMELKAPEKGFLRYTLNGPLKWERAYKLPKKESDFRVVVLRNYEEKKGSG